MSPQELLEHNNIRLPQYSIGRYYTTCPQCSSKRKVSHQRLKVLGVTIGEADKVFWGCNHCGWTGPKNNPGFDYSGRFKHRSNGGSYYWDPGSGDPGLYRINEVLETDGLVAIVEGERDCNTLWDLGIAATCGPHGANSWTKAYSEQLRGRVIVVLNDHDDAGYKYAAKVIECCRGVVAKIKRLDLAEHWPGDVPDGMDVTDFLESRAGDAQLLLELINEAPELNGHHPENKPPPLSRRARLLDWRDVDPPVRQWSVLDRIPAQAVNLLSGHGGTGKSLLGLHLCVAHALGRDWLKSLPEPGPALFIDCEDDETEIHIRLAALVTHYGVSYQDLYDCGFDFFSMVGQDCVMAVVLNSKTGSVAPTPFFAQVLEYVGDVKPRHIVIANSANVFAGNENDRSQVQQFTGMLKRLALAATGAVTLIAHPSLTGLNNNSGLSGSTAWHNSVRSRQWLRGMKDDDGNRQESSDLRALEFQKNQSGQLSETIILRWKEGMFLPEPGLSSVEVAAKLAKVEAKFLELLRRLTGEHRPVSHKKAAHNYAPKAFAELADAEGISRKDFEQAMEALFKAGSIQVKTYGPPSKGFQCIEPS